MTEVFVGEVLNQIRVRKRSDNGFKAEVWKEVCKEVKARGLGPEELTGEKCQGKLDAVSCWTRSCQHVYNGFKAVTAANLNVILCTA